MAKALLIAEKPSLMKAVRDVYNKNKSKINDEIEFQTFAGHTMTLKMPGELNPEWDKWSLSSLPIIPEKLEYKVDNSKKKMYSEIKKQIKHGNYDYIINCCDAGREGQAIFHTFYRSLNCKLPVKRMWILDMTESKLLDYLLNMRDDLNEPALYNMTEASILRAHFDWLIGMNYSPAYTLRANTGKAIGVGRVMTPTLAILVNRELEIKNFVPKDYYNLEADFGEYTGTYFNIVDKKENSRLETKEDVEKLIASLSLKPNDSKVIATDKKKSLKYAPSLHSLSELQAEASRAFGYTLQETLALVQTLYEKQLLSYPRTDSRHITSSMTKDFPRMLACLKSVPNLEEHVDGVLKESKRLSSVASNKDYVDDSKVSDHYAITPTGNTADLSRLSPQEGNIYTLVAKRFLSIFMDPQVTERSVIVTENNSHKFKTNGTILIDKGFTVLYGTTVNDKTLPPISKGDTLTINKTSTISKKTSPPPRYTDASLVEILENVSKLVEDKALKSIMKEAKGIGTSATRDGIIEKLIKNKYITRKGKGKSKQFHATDYGISVIEGLRGQDIILPELTAEWESKLLNIEKCIYDPKDFEKEMVQYIKIKTEEMKNMTVKIEGSKKTLGTCPICKKNEIIEGKKGFGCLGYKDDGCNFTIWKESNYYKDKVIGTKEAQSLLKGESIFGNLKLNADGKLEYAQKESIGKCPICGKDIRENSKAFGCSGYSDKTCNFAIWKEVSGKTLTSEDAQALLSGKSINNMKLNKNGQIEFGESGPIGKCPICKKDVKENSRAFGCSGYSDKTCNFAIWKEVAGAKITPNDAKKLLAGESTNTKTFKKKDNSGTFTATLILKDNKVSFNF